MCVGLSCVSYLSDVLCSQMSVIKQKSHAFHSIQPLEGDIAWKCGKHGNIVVCDALVY